MTEIAEHTLGLLKCHEQHPEVSNRHLGELFGITKQRVGKIIRRDKRDRLVGDYCKTHPEVSPAEVAHIFHITEYRVLMLNHGSQSSD